MSKTATRPTKTVKGTLIIDGESCLKFFFEKNPYAYDLHEKKISKFMKAALLNWNVKVFFHGVLTHHSNIIEYKHKFTRNYSQKRKANSHKLSSQSSYLASVLLEKYGSEIYFSKEVDLTQTIYQYALQSSSDEVIIVTKLANLKKNVANPDFEKRINFYDRINLWFSSAFFIAANTTSADIE